MTLHIIVEYRAALGICNRFKTLCARMREHMYGPGGQLCSLVRFFPIDGNNQHFISGE